jgi:hypothetical protein
MGDHVCVNFLPYSLQLANNKISVDQNGVAFNKSVRDGALPASNATG